MDEPPRLILVETLVDVDPPGGREATHGDGVGLAELPDRAPAPLRPVGPVVGVLLLYPLVFAEVLRDLLPNLVLRQPQLDHLVPVVQIPHAGHVVIVGVGDDQVVEPPTAALALRQPVVEELEQVDAAAGAAVGVDQHVGAPGQANQGRVTLAHVHEGHPELAHVLHATGGV